MTFDIYKVSKLVAGFVFAAMTAVSLSAANANIISDNTAGSDASVTGVYWGQSVLTGSGTSWNNLQMNFYTGSTPIAFGNLYMFSSEYSGAPNGLSSSTYLASASDFGSTWDFAPSVTVAANTMYWFYSDSVNSGSLTGNSDNSKPVEDYYYSFNGSSNFNNGGTAINYLLTGTPSTSVPEPATYTMLLAGLGLFCFMARRRNNFTA